MAVPTAYLTTSKNLEAMLNAITTAQAPPKFTQTFLEGLGFKSKSDRLIINVLKALGLLTPSGEPTQRYYDYLDPAQSGRVLADAMRDAYSDVFQLKRDAQTMSRTELKGKLKTLTQGQYSDAVLSKMALTFDALAKLADWSAPPALPPGDSGGDAPAGEEDGNGAGNGGGGDRGGGRARLPIDGLVYNIQIQLPESRNQAVYDALFKSLREHLLQ